MNTEKNGYNFNHHDNSHFNKESNINLTNLTSQEELNLDVNIDNSENRELNNYKIFKNKIQKQI